MGRIAVIKMLLLTKILYYLGTLPIQLPSQLFLSPNTATKQHIWKGQNLRLSFHVLTKQKFGGSMGFPVIQDYYKVALLDQLRACFEPDTIRPWLAMEQYLIANKDLLVKATAQALCI